MSNTSDVRDALKGASGALTAAEIGDIAGLTGGDTSKLLYPMIQAGEVEKLEGEGRATYIRNPKFPSKKAKAASDAAPERIPAKPRGKAARREKVTKRKAPRVSRLPKAEIAAAVARTVALQEAKMPTEPRPFDMFSPPADDALVLISSRSLRELLASTMQSERPLSSNARAAAAEAIGAVA